MPVSKKYAWEVAILLTLGCATAASQLPEHPIPPTATQDKTTYQQRPKSPAERSVTNTRPPIAASPISHESHKRYVGQYRQNAQAQANKWTDPLTWFTAALVLVGALQWLVYLRQARIMKRQVELARSQARAFIFLESIEHDITTAIDLRDQTVTLPSGTDKGLYVAYFAIRPRWRNSGATATKSMNVQINVSQPGGTLPRDFDYPYNDPRRPSPQTLFVGPQATEASETIQISPSFARAIINNGSPHLGETPTMFVWGRADYTDIFGTPHFTEWCRQVQFDRPVGDRVRATFIQWGDHNRTDGDTGARRWWARL